MKVQLIYPCRNTKQIDVRIGELTLHFSYRTVVAFNSPFSGFVVSENRWSTTTGRHLNEIDGGSTEAKAERLPIGEFEQKLEDTLIHYKLD